MVIERTPRIGKLSCESLAPIAIVHDAPSSDDPTATTAVTRRHDAADDRAHTRLVTGPPGRTSCRRTARSQLIERPRMNSRNGGVGIIGVIVIVLVILFLVGVIKL